MPGSGIARKLSQRIDRRKAGNRLGRGARGMPDPLVSRLGGKDMRFHHEKIPTAEEEGAAAELQAAGMGNGLSAHKQSYIIDTAARIREKDRSFAGQLCAAALLGDAARIALIIEMMEDKRGVNWNAKLRLNPLQLACYALQRSAVGALLRCGASATFLIPGARLGWDASALHTACQNSDGWFAETLLASGANPYKANSASAARGGGGGSSSSSSAAAARAASRTGGVGIGKPRAQSSALDIALEYRQASVLQVLVARGFVKNGWLQKQSRALNGLGKWKRRWFECVRMPGGRVMKMCYFKRPVGAPMRGVLHIVPRAARRVGAEVRGDFCVTCTDASKRQDVRLRAPSSVAANSWIEWLTVAQVDGRSTGGGWVATGGFEGVDAASLAVEFAAAEYSYSDEGQVSVYLFRLII